MEPVDGLAALRAWQADVGFIDDLPAVPPWSPDGNTESRHVLDDFLYVMVPLSHPLAQKDTIALEDLHQENWALDTVPNTYSLMLVKSCENVGYTPVVNAKCNGFEVVIALVEAGCSVSVMPGLRVRSYQGNFAARRLVPEIRRRISVAFRKGEMRNPAIAAFVRELEARAHLLGEASPPGLRS